MRSFLIVVSISLVCFVGVESLHIQVCQNKSCCKHWRHSTPLPDVLRDLLGPDVAIESTGCMGQCQRGPNLCLKAERSKDELILSDIRNPTAAAAHLEALASIAVPSKLLAAVNVLDKAKKADSFEEKERFVSSIIKALEIDYKQSTALARALIYRAKLYTTNKQLFEAETDAMHALDILKPSENMLVYQATIALADVFELQGNIDEAANLLQDLADNDRSMRSKVMKEVERLRSLRSTSAIR